MDDCHWYCQVIGYLSIKYMPETKIIAIADNYDIVLVQLFLFGKNSKFEWMRGSNCFYTKKSHCSNGWLQLKQQFNSIYYIRRWLQWGIVSHMSLVFSWFIWLANDKLLVVSSKCTRRDLRVALNLWVSKRNFKM